jgi:hypothetical protein
MIAGLNRYPYVLGQFIQRCLNENLTVCPRDQKARKNREIEPAKIVVHANKPADTGTPLISMLNLSAVRDINGRFLAVNSCWSVRPRQALSIKPLRTRRFKTARPEDIGKMIIELTGCHYQLRFALIRSD